VSCDNKWVNKVVVSIGFITCMAVCAREEKISTLGLGKSQNQVSINY